MCNNGRFRISKLLALFFVPFILRGRLLRRTDIGNRIPCADNEKGPTRLDLFYSYFLNECSAEWLAEQLSISMDEVERIYSLWNDDFQERTPETAEKLETALKELIGSDVYEEAVNRDRQREEDHKALIERHKLWGLEAIPLQTVEGTGQHVGFKCAYCGETDVFKRAMTRWIHEDGDCCEQCLSDRIEADQR
jgi:hypothetical protein